MILAGTERGLIALDPEPRALLERPVTAVSVHEGETWVLTEDGELLCGKPEALESVARVTGDPGTCLLACDAGVFVGTARARLLVLHGDVLATVDGFDHVEGRNDWYTPWGGPPDTRSLAAARDGTLYVNVHVGGIVRGRGDAWEPTIDIDADIHQVLVAPDGRVMATGAYALSVSADGGATWTGLTDGFDATYMRALAIAGDTLLVTASRSHAGGDAGIYRRALVGDGVFERGAGGLPAPVSADNIDTGWLVADDERAVFATAEGDVWRSRDEGVTWERIARDLQGPRWLALA